jgi:hypothetical protein
MKMSDDYLAVAAGADLVAVAEVVGAPLDLLQREPPRSFQLRHIRILFPADPRSFGNSPTFGSQVKNKTHTHTHTTGGSMDPSASAFPQKDYQEQKSLTGM